MSELSAADILLGILCCGGWSTSFSDELFVQDVIVVLMRFLYALSEEAIKLLVENKFDVVMADVRRNQGDFV